MRVGVLDTWLSNRYLPFWEPYFEALEVEVVPPMDAEVRLPMPLPIRRVLQKVYGLKNQGVDYLLLPDVQLGVEPQRGNPTPWMVDLAATLERLVPGLPPALVVPAELSPNLVGLAAEIGQTLTRNPMLARRALERTKRLLETSFKPPKQPGKRLIGLVAQPMLAEDTLWLEGLRNALSAQGLNLFLADKAPAELRQEGQKLGLELELPTDLEAAGMHRYLSRMGRIEGLIYAHDPDYLPLPRPLRRLLRRWPPAKPFQVVGLEEAWESAVKALAESLA
ncbi:hypothetical protein [Meiothermus rufus]|uniref:hypothetical protein n=1 Tax=Meiothermus rufus TaxID=604332 RepID=UPI000411FEAC|nr:hypothetical protein [Meiothermus rufus]